MPEYTLSVGTTALPAGSSIEPNHVHAWLVNRGVMVQEVVAVDATTVRVAALSDPAGVWPAYDNARTRRAVARTALQSATTLAQLKAALVIALGGDD